MHLLIKSCF